jgi:hypothetical protein
MDAEHETGIEIAWDDTKRGFKVASKFVAGIFNPAQWGTKETA